MFTSMFIGNIDLIFPSFIKFIFSFWFSSVINIFCIRSPVTAEELKSGYLMGHFDFIYIYIYIYIYICTYI
jgi:hypothetical protein